MKKTLINLDYTPYAYSDTGLHTVRISDTAKSLVLVGNKQGVDNKLKEQLVEINNVGRNVEELGPYCCYGCSCLTSVYSPNVKHYGDYSFAHSNISAVSPFSTGNVVFAVGAHAFEGTQLTSVSLALSGKGIIDPADPENGYQGCKLRKYSDGPYIGDYAFRDCKQLKEVTILEHPDIAAGMFEGCSALSSVEFSKNYGACVGSFAFKDCVSLSSITFPQNWELISKNMFDGCSALSAVNFTSADSKLVTIENNAFNGCSSLTSLTLPDSIDSFSLLDENAFAGSSLKKVTFSNINSDVFRNFKTQDAKWIVVPEDYTTESDFKYGVWYLNRCRQLIPYAIENNIPLIVKMCSPGCGFCKSFNKTTFNTEEFQAECAKRPYLFMECLYYLDEDIPYRLTDADLNYMYCFHQVGLSNYQKKKYGFQWDIPWDHVHSTFVILCALWHKPDGSWVAKQWRTDGTMYRDNQTAELFKKFDTYFAGYERDSKYNGPGYVQPQYVSFNGWGLDHDCDLYQSDYSSQSPRHHFRFNYDEKTIVEVTDENGSTTP